jgi:hypothetical protein
MQYSSPVVQRVVSPQVNTPDGAASHEAWSEYWSQPDGAWHIPEYSQQAPVTGSFDQTSMSVQSAAGLMGAGQIGAPWHSSIE